MKIINVEPCSGSRNQGVANFDIQARVYGEDYIFGGMTYYQKGDSTWASGPNQRYEKDGELKYKRIGHFVNEVVQRRFLAQVKLAFEEYLATNPNMTPEPVIDNTFEECPF